MRFRGTVYRAHNPEWAWTPLSGEGARRYGGRFNRRGMPALYCSLSQITAIREATPVGRPMQPLTLCAYQVDAEPVFDATDQMRLRESDVLEAELACPTWQADMLDRGVAASQRLAERLVAAGYVGITRPQLRRWRKQGRSEPRDVALGECPPDPSRPNRRRGSPCAAVPRTLTVAVAKARRLQRRTHRNTQPPSLARTTL